MPMPPRMLEYDGQSKSLDEWCKIYRIPPSTLRARIDQFGWDVGRALTTRIDRRFTKGGRRKTGTPRPCPKMLRHKSGRAYCEWVAFGERRSVYFGPWDSEEAKAAYRKFAAEWVAAGAPGPPNGHEVTVARAILMYLEFAERHYRKRDKITSEVHCIRTAMEPLNLLYGEEPLTGLTPKKLKAVRAAMVERGWARNTVNSHTGRIVRMAKWAAVEELCSAEVANLLALVPSLSAGRTEAPESEPRQPIPTAHIEAVMPHLHEKEPRRAVLEAMIRFQLLAGFRPGEVCAVRSEDLDRSPAHGGLWRYESAEFNKMLHREVRRVLWIGPRAQAIIEPHLATAERGQPIFRLPPWRKGQGWSTVTTQRFRLAIKAACERAGVPVWIPHRLRHTRTTEVMRIYESDEAAGAAIGDTPEVARQVYAESPGDAVARRIAREVG